jgi:hypothetical protein
VYGVASSVTLTDTEERSVSEPLSPSALMELSSLSGIPVDDTAMAERIAAGAAAAVEAVHRVATVCSAAAGQGDDDLDPWLFELEPSGYLALLEQLAEEPR